MRVAYRVCGIAGSSEANQALADSQANGDLAAGHASGAFVK